jgi:demethylspheroidene O-methyltransferase
MEIQLKPTTPDDVIDLMDASFASAALGAAMELGLFWLLDDQPLESDGVARALGIPPIRCYYWLQLLCRTGLIQRGSKGYEPAAAARSAILAVYDRDSWAVLAEEARQRLSGLYNLACRIRERSSPREVPEGAPPMYVRQMTEDQQRARRFIRMLYDIHHRLAEELAGALDLKGVKRLMDLGGGSGVVSLALARAYPELTAVVVDITNVCAVGREIAVENSLDERVSYHAIDFSRDDLPAGFDVVLECDVNIYTEELFQKVRKSLNPGGRFIIVDQFAPAEGAAPPARLHWAFEHSLVSPEFVFPTAARMQDLLVTTGFQLIGESSFRPEPRPCRRFVEGLVIVEARK